MVRLNEVDKEVHQLARLPDLWTTAYIRTSRLLFDVETIFFTVYVAILMLVSLVGIFALVLSECDINFDIGWDRIEFVVKIYL